MDKVELKEFNGQACIFCRGPVLGTGVGFYYDVICMKCVKKICGALGLEIALKEPGVKEGPDTDNNLKEVTGVEDNAKHTCEHCGAEFGNVKRYAVHQRWCRSKKNGLKSEGLV